MLLQALHVCCTLSGSLAACPLPTHTHPPPKKNHCRLVQCWGQWKYSFLTDQRPRWRWGEEEQKVYVNDMKRVRWWRDGGVMVA